MLRTWLQIELGLVKKEDTILGHALSSIWGDHIPGVEEFITVAGGHYDQSTEAMKARDDAAKAAAVSKLSMTKWEKLQQQRHRRSEKREWGERAKRLIADLPAGGLVLFTDGGSNPSNREETGWGVVVVRKEAAGAPTLIAELFGQVTADPFDVVTTSERSGGWRGESGHTSHCTRAKKPRSCGTQGYGDPCAVHHAPQHHSVDGNTAAGGWPRVLVRGNHQRFKPSHRSNFMSIWAL